MMFYLCNILAVIDLLAIAIFAWWIYRSDKKWRARLQALDDAKWNREIEDLGKAIDGRKS